MLQISEYFVAEFLLACSTIAFFIQIRTATPKRSYRLIGMLAIVFINTYFAAVVYRSKGDRPWSNLADREQFKVLVGVGVDSGAWNRALVYAYFGSKAGMISDRQHGKEILCPINIYATVRVVNTSPYPIRIMRYSAKIKENGGWLTPWEEATAIPLNNGMVVSGRNAGYTPKDMFLIESSLPPLDSLGSKQIEAARDIEGWIALEYPGHMIGGPDRQIELRIESDLAGTATGRLDIAARYDHNSVNLNGKNFMQSFYQYFDLSAAKFEIGRAHV